MFDEFRSDDRAVSQVFGYALTLSIATLLIGTLLIAATGFVDGQRKLTGQSELEVIGQQVSADISAADRLARTDDVTETTVSRKLPRQVVGASYTMAVRSGGGPTDPYLELEIQQLDVTVEVGLVSKTAVEVGAAAGGGTIEVTYNTTNDELVLQNA